MAQIGLDSPRLVHWSRVGVSDMWKAISLLLAGAVFGSAFGVALGLYLFPLVFQPAPPASGDTLTISEQSQVLARGTFIQANPFDTSRYGKGQVTVYPGVVYLDEDFEVSPGPRYRVYLVPKIPVRQSAHVADTRYIDLGALKAFKGAQKFALPRGVNIREYPSVVIWGNAYGELVSPADLSFDPDRPSS